MPKANPDIVVEWGILMRGGGYELRNSSQEVEDVYPVVEWLENQTRLGMIVCRRQIIVVRDWVRANVDREAPGKRLT